MPKKNFLWDGEFLSAYSHSLCLLSQKTYCTKVLWGQDTCEISPDECPSHCRAFILFLSSLPSLFLLIYRLSLLPGRTDHLTSIFPGLQTASQMQTQGQSTGKHLPEGPVPLEREILFVWTKALPAHLGARKTWPPKCLCKGNKRSTNVIRWNH